MEIEFATRARKLLEIRAWDDSRGIINITTQSTGALDDRYLSPIWVMAIFQHTRCTATSRL